MDPNKTHVNILINAKEYEIIYKYLINLIKLIGNKQFTFNITISSYQHQNIHDVDTLNSNINIIFHNKSTILPEDYNPDYILSIAPDLDFIIQESACVNLKGFSHFGFSGKWNKFYDPQSTIIEYTLRKKIPYIMTTPTYSFENVYSEKTLIEINKVSTEIYEHIARESFKMITSQLYPLEHIDILEFTKNFSKPNIKLQTIKHIMSKYEGPIYELDSIMHDWIYQMCVVYINNIEETLQHQGDTEFLFTNQEETINYFYQMTVCLYKMGMPCLDKNQIRLQYDTDEDPSEEYPEAFEKFKEIGLFIISNDLTATFNLVDLLGADQFFVY